MRVLRSNLLSVFLVAAVSVSTGLVGQAKRPLNHDDYDKWPSIRSTAYAPDGGWIAYEVRPKFGDGVLHVRAVDGDTHYEHKLGTRPAFSADSKKLVFSIGKSSMEAYQKKIDKLLGGGKSKELAASARKKAAEEEKSAAARRAEMIARMMGRRGRGGAGAGSSSGTGTVAILDLATGKVEKIEKTKSFRLLQKGKLLAYHKSAPEKKADPKADAAKKKAAEEKAGTGKSKEAGSGAGAGARRGERRGGRRGATAGARSARRSGRAGSRGATSGRSSSASSGGTDLVIRNLANGTETVHHGVTRFQTLKKDAWLMLTLVAAKGGAKDAPEESKKPKEPGEQKGREAEAAPAVKSGLVAVHLDDGRTVRLFDGEASFSGFVTDRHEKRVAISTDLTDRRAAAKRAEAAKRKAEAAKRKAASEKVASEKVAAAKKEGGGATTKTAPKKVAKAPAAKKDAKDKKRNRQEIFVWDFSDRAPRRLFGQDVKGMPKDATLSASGLSFSTDGSVLTFSIGLKAPEKPPEILPEEKVNVDIWHWNDGMIQSMQAKRRGESLSRTCVWHLDEERMVVLGDEAMPTMRLLTRDGSRALATDSEPYEKLMTWDGRYSDVYIVNTQNGERERVITKLRGRTTSSPSGRYLLYFDRDYHWYAIDVETNKTRCLTRGLQVAFQNVLDDRPQPSSAYGIAGWVAGEKAVVINDRYDLWKISLDGEERVCLTDGYGRANQIVLRYSRFDLEGDDDQLDPEARSYLPQTLMLSAKNDETKARGYYTDTLDGVSKPRKLVMMDKAIGGLQRARSADRVFFTCSTFAEFPNIWTASLDFENPRQLTDACKIQEEVRWGDAELVSWTNDDGVRLQGFLVKPEGFDPQRRYPMMVYFYERNADNVHRYTTPSPGTSPNAAYYVSNGYLWFVPDIVYTIGYPGESAEKCIISGVQHLIAQGFVDRHAIGMAGHSWGGYQTAHLVTRTNLFAAAESGAPVSNMFSAYGGIRYQSGMSRQFQYERTQSRIGGTPWQYPQRYWQNSPVFYADRVQTPVLLLHNDNDGAVPWTNGLEFFMALRRLGKEAYLFNYNGEPHGLRKSQNQKDWTRRMAEFFAHHLKGEPAPAWMREGVKFADRDREKVPYTRSFKERQRRKAASEEGIGGGSK